jgi:hypothetical protein
MSPLPYDTDKQVAQSATTVTPNRQYHSTLSGKSAFLSEVKTVLQAMDAGQNVDQIREAVLEEDLLDRRTWHRRSTVWKEVFRRYISGRDPEHVAALARMVTHCPNPSAVDLALFYEYCQVDALLYENKHDFADVPSDVLDKLQIIFFSDPLNAAFRAMGLE